MPLCRRQQRYPKSKVHHFRASKIEESEPPLTDTFERCYVPEPALLAGVAKLAYASTVGLIALWDKDDQWRDAAERAYESITNARRTAVTTTFILLECGCVSAWRGRRRPRIVDHVSFLVMKRLAIAEGFTNDKHFEAAGFKVLF
jgi:predicted nucleic acid-binding protein